MEKEYVYRYLKEHLPLYLSSTASSLISKRIISQLDSDLFYKEKNHENEDCGDILKTRLSCFIDNYLNPSLKYLNDPFLMSDMDKAVKRIIKALLEDESVCIYGDYDVDGITATSFLVAFLRELKKILKKNGGKDSVSIFYKLPDRIKDGYGLGIDPIDEIYAEINDKGGKPLSLIIAVDLGITGVKEVEYAKSKNIDVIICDHHEVPLNGEEEILPPAFAVLNPKRKGDKFPFKFLPGVGIAFNLGIAIRKILVKEELLESCPNLKDYLDIVCLGIVADIVPMYGDNRILTRYGLQILNQNPRPGIKELRRICGLHFDNVNESDIAWKIAPKINAAGRVGDPSIAVELLTQNDQKSAFNLAQELESFNRKRQQLEDACFTEAMNLIEEKAKVSEMPLPIIILKGESWHPGVIGIASSKISDYFKKPVLLLTGYKEKVYIGSARSCGDIDIYAFLKQYESFFIKFGGHKMACGLTLKKGSDTENFIAAVVNNSAEYNKAAYGGGRNAEKRTSSYQYDEEIDIELLSGRELPEIIKIISPCGPLNEQPKFLLRDINLLDINRREFKNKNSKNKGYLNCYFTLNISRNSLEKEKDAAKHKAMVFNRQKSIGDILNNSVNCTENAIKVDGIIFELFNGYIKILDFI
ncbi:MAG: single-stranded-DNA-specific exonuclease RecJ [Candidatus Acidulodesulfobacterium sp.]